jgi:hypothetical protein
MLLSDFNKIEYAKKGFSGLSTIQYFLKYLEQYRLDHLKTIATFEYAFEGWLKYEFLCFLTNYLEIKDDFAGLEYSIRLFSKKQKKVDAWFSRNENLEAYHYFEFKCAFNNINFSKQVSAFTCDFATLLQIDTKDKKDTPDDILSVLFASPIPKFELNNKFLSNEIDKFAKELGISQKPEIVEVSGIYVAILSHSFRKCRFPIKAASCGLKHT